MRLIDDDERRARLGLRHIIEPGRSATIEELVDRLVVLHATDPATIYLAVGARRPEATTADIDRCLFDDRTLYRTLAMRRTLFVVTRETGPQVEVSSAPAVARTERKRLEQYLTNSGIEPAADWLADVFEQVLAELGTAAAVGGRSARDLGKAIPDLATRIMAGPATRHAVEMPATSRVLGLMAVEGLLVRGRPSGGWTARQYVWHRRDRWWPERWGPERQPDEEGGDDVESACSVRLLERWLCRFGPGTLTDLVWWTGWTKTKTRKALAGLDTVEVDLGGESASEPGLVLAGDEEPVAVLDPWAALLPALDPTAMGWKQRGWYLGPHVDRLFDRNGNIGPTVWVDGKIVGGWSQTPDGQVVVGYLEDVGSDRRALVERQVGRIQAFVGDVVVKPSFPTPLQRELSVG